MRHLLIDGINLLLSLKVHFSILALDNTTFFTMHVAIRSDFHLAQKFVSPDFLVAFHNNTIIIRSWKNGFAFDAFCVSFSFHSCKSVARNERSNKFALKCERAKSDPWDPKRRRKKKFSFASREEKKKRSWEKWSKEKEKLSSHLHVGVDHLLELVGVHLGHGVDQVEQLAAHRVVRNAAPRKNVLNVLKENFKNK